MSKHNQIHEERDDGSYVVKKSKKHSIFAFIVCVLIAFVIWAYVEATDNKMSQGTSETAVATQSSAQTCEES